MRMPDQLDLPLDSDLNCEAVKSPDQRWDGLERSFPYRGCGQIDHATRAYHDPIHGIKVVISNPDPAVKAKSGSAQISEANTVINQQGGSHV